MASNSSKPVAVEHHFRSLAKAISWRITGTLDTMVISFIITGRVKLALSIGFVELFTKIGLYYLHERAWNRIALGKTKSRVSGEIWPQRGDYGTNDNHPEAIANGSAEGERPDALRHDRSNAGGRAGRPLRG